MTNTSETLTIRMAYGDDYAALARLAALDSAEHVPARPVLIAETDGRIRAALSLSDGSSISDPFYRSAELLTLLRTRARSDLPPVRRRLAPPPRGRRLRLGLSSARG